MRTTTRIGIDLAKHVFQLHGVDECGHTVLRRRVSRPQLRPYVAQLRPGLIGLEACGSAHYWARELTTLGHDVRLIAPQFVAPYRKNDKNDGNDTEAICEAVGRPHMRFVPVKDVRQQAVLTVRRARQLLVAERTALVHQTRGLLAEYGLIVSAGIGALRRALPGLLESPALPALAREVFIDRGPKAPVAMVAKKLGVSTATLFQRTGSKQQLMLMAFQPEGTPVTELDRGLQPGVPVCFVIHGSFVNWPTVCEESRRAQSWLRDACPGQPMHLVFFTWPSNEMKLALLPMDVALLGRRAGRHAQDVAQLVGQIPDDHPICFIGHSHGARMAIATLHLLAGGEIDGICCPSGPYQNHRIRAVLAAAALDHEWLNPGERYERAVYRAEAIANLQNRRDLALAIYPLNCPGASRALGRTGLTCRDDRKLGAWSAKVIDVDVSDDVGHKHIWPAYLDEPSIAQRIVPYVFFTDR